MSEKENEYEKSSLEYNIHELEYIYTWTKMDSSDKKVEKDLGGSNSVRFVRKKLKMRDKKRLDQDLDIMKNWIKNTDGQCPWV